MNLVPGFLAAAEVGALCGCAAAIGWTAGRQGTGYEILSLKLVAVAAPPIARALAHLGTPFRDFWDAYLIRYRDGSHVPPHTDAAEHGRRHRRLNAMLALPDHGGELRIAGVRVDLAVGDAVVFEPDHELHDVSPVGGTRLVFSVGAWI